MAKTITAPLVGVRLPPWATFLRGIYPGLLSHLQQQATWRLATTEDTTHEIPPVLIDKDWQGDGLIVFRCSAEEIAAWHGRGICVVSISSEVPRPDLPQVIPDNSAIGRLAAEHLLSRGLRSFAFWQDPTRTYARERRDGFVAALDEAGYETQLIGLPVSELPLSDRWPAIERTIREQLANSPRPLGIFAKDDISAAAIVRCCQAQGLRVPNDVAVIGCNDDPAFVYTSTPGLTSVAYPGRAIGAAAAALLDRLLNSSSHPPSLPKRIPPGPVIKRQSTAVFDFDEPLVGEVLTWIHNQRPSGPVQVSQLAAQLAVAEATLRRRFRRATGRTVKATIDEHRLRRIQEQLQGGEDSIKAIAYRFGFASPEELSRFTKRCCGKSPSQWRAAHR